MYSSLHLSAVHRQLAPIALFCLLWVGGIVPSLAQPTSSPSSDRPPSNSALSKVYHNVTARFNGYFNAQLKLDEGKESLASQYNDNYNQLLDMYPYMAVPDAKTAYPSLDMAITKAAVDIRLHPRSLFVDDCYLLIGQANYVKRDYEAAEKSFNFIITTFDPDNPNNPLTKAVTKKEKQKQREQTAKDRKKQREQEKKARDKQRDLERKAKEKAREARRNGDRDAQWEDFMPKPKEEKSSKEKAPKYVFKHRPIRTDAMLWLARTKIERGQYDEARVWIQRVAEQDKKLVKSLRAELAALDAYYYLKQKRYDEAITPLNKAIKLMRDKEQKRRWAYLVAQIHQQAGRQQDAAIAFERVIKLKPSYDMEFSARLSMLKNTFADDLVALANAEKALKALLKDEKNEEYKDQIYYTLADIAFQMEDEPQGIAYLKKSVFYNFGNKGQKAESYLKLADLYFAKEGYVNAKYYYDSTLTVLPQNDERFARVEFRSQNLTDIANNIQIITLQDSLLNIAALIEAGDEKAYLAIAQRIKDQREADEKAKAKPQLQRRTTAIGQSAGLAGANTQNNAVPEYWAYNANEVQRGRRDFQRVWGADRKLSDNWRRSSRANAGGNFDIDEQEEAVFFELTTADAIKLFEGMGVPRSEVQKQQAQKQIMDALAALGTLYRERLDNSQKSIEALEQLITRFPDNPYLLESYYSLYIQHQALGNTAKAKTYRDLILKNGRNSKFAKAIEDPNYIQGEQQKEQQLQAYYNDAYAAFNNGDYKAAREKIDKVGAQFGNDYAMKPKFALLGAMCTGAIDGKDAYIQGLKEIKSKYAETDEAQKATEILAILDGQAIAPVSSKASTGNSDKPTGGRPRAMDASGFMIDDNSQHYVMVAYNGKKLQQTAATAAVADYNRKYHRLKNLRVSNFLITVDIPTILIRRFDNMTEAMAYVTEAQKSAQEFIGSDDPSVQIIAINIDNYRTILRERDKWNAYLQFFADKY